MAAAEERIIRLPFLCMLGMDGVYKVLSVINNINEIHPSSQYCCRLPKNHLLYVALVDTIELRLAIVCASVRLTACRITLPAVLSIAPKTH